MSVTPKQIIETDGFEFIEYTAPDPGQLATLFEQLGFRVAARHRSKQVTLYRQGSTHFILDAEPHGFAQSFARVHGPSICAIAFRVPDAGRALEIAVARGAEPVTGVVGPMELNIPAIKGIGGSLIYLIDRYGDHTIYDVDFIPEEGGEEEPSDVGLDHIDHITHNVHRGRMDSWARFYERLFGFRETQTFEIEGIRSGLYSRAMTSRCGKIRIPINESADDHSQIAEYLAAYKGEGIQHIALSTPDIHATVDALRARGVRFLPTPDTYYAQLDTRLPGHGLDVEGLRSRAILVDGEVDEEESPRLLLQIFTENVIGPIFFEIIERRGDKGFGEGNFQALFEAIERDQIARGVLEEE
jgi:4-hydroxyphenylpyruvate dioxygenase